MVDVVCTAGYGKKEFFSEENCPFMHTTRGLKEFKSLVRCIKNR